MNDPDPAPSPLCRDCGSRQERRGRCTACGSPRLLRHPELHDLTLAHIDCDSFYATVEKRDNPALAALPVIVGGGRRGVVTTCCYIARSYGVRSAMPMFQALELCPGATVIPPRIGYYSEVSRALRRLFEGVTPLVEPVSIDEAFLDLSGTARLHGAHAAPVLAGLARRIESEIGITVSIGLSWSRFLAKVASDMNKPRGFSVIGRAEALAFLKDKPASLIPGVGPAFAATLKSDGITLIGQLQQMDEDTLMRRYGVHGRRLARLAHGEDSANVDPDTVRKGVSAEVTLDQDLAQFEEIETILWTQCRRVSATLKEKGLAGRTVSLKLRIGRHKGVSRSVTPAAPVQLAGELFEITRNLLASAHEAGTPVRLIGCGVAGLVPHVGGDAPDLIDPGKTKRQAAERAADKVLGRFGPGSIRTGRDL